MTDHEDLIRRLRAYAQERYLGSRCPNLVHEAADAIKELVAENEAVRLANLDCVDMFNQMRERAEKAEAAWDKWRSLGTVQNFLACDDDTKIACFRQGLQESERRKKAEADLAAARAAYLELLDFHDVEGCGPLADLFRQHCTKHAAAIAAARRNDHGQE